MIKPALLLLTGILMTTTTLEAAEPRPGVLRTPDDRFSDLAGYDFAPNYVDIDGYRVHYLDEGPAGGEVVLMLHGEPTWSYLYRKMIPVITAAGFRAIVPDLIGFGRSDKPVDMEVHSYAFHVETQSRLLEALDLENITFVGQDWGGLIGLRVVAENEARFARVAIANTGLPAPTGDEPPMTEAFMAWKAANQRMIDRGDMEVGRMVAGNVGDPALVAAYDAPFPDASYKAGPLIMPQLVPITADYPGAAENRAAWEVFSRWDKPFLTSFSDGDPITRGGERVFQRRIPGAAEQNHSIIEGAGHFLQEQKGEEWAQLIVEFIEANP